MVLTKVYEPTILLLTFVVSFLGIYVAVGIAEQLRLSLIDDRSVHGSEVRISRRKKHLLYIIFCALGVGAISIWGMHYVSLFSLQLVDEEGNKVPFQSNASIQIITLVMIFIFNVSSLTTAFYDDMFSKTKVAIIKEFIAESKSLSMKEIRSITLKKVLMTIASRRLGRIIVGGTMSSLGVLLTFYISMHSITFAGHIKYHIGWTVFAVFISWSASVVAYWVFFRLLSIFPDQEWLRMSVAILGSIATSIGNFIVLTSAEFHSGAPTSLKELPTDRWNHQTSFYVAFITVNVLLWTIAIYIMMTARYMIYRQSRMFQLAENIVYKIAEEHSLTVPLSRQQQQQQDQRNAEDHSLNTGHTTVKHMVEHYINRRSEGDLMLHHRSISIKENAWLQEQQQLYSMSFSEYFLHLGWMLLTCQWDKFMSAIRIEFCSDSTTASESNSRHTNNTNHDATPNRGDFSHSGGARGDNSNQNSYSQRFTKNNSNNSIHGRSCPEEKNHSHGEKQTADTTIVKERKFSEKQRKLSAKIIPTMEAPYESETLFDYNNNTTTSITVDDDANNNLIDTNTKINTNDNTDGCDRHTSSCDTKNNEKYGLCLDNNDKQQLEDVV